MLIAAFIRGRAFCRAGREREGSPRCSRREGSQFWCGHPRLPHKGLELLFAAGKVSKVQAEHAEWLRLILGRLNVARAPRDMACRAYSSTR